MKAWQEGREELAKAFDLLCAALSLFTDGTTVAESRCSTLALRIRRGWHRKDAELLKLARRALQPARALLDYQAERHHRRSRECESAYEAAKEEVEVLEARSRLLASNITITLDGRSSEAKW